VVDDSNFPASPMLPMKRRGKDSSLEGCEPVSAQMKVRQSCKLRELGDALLSAGFLTLDAQANALGLARRTTWTILTGSHKASGLSASTINRMLAAPQLPPLARSKIREYVEEKAAGLYGGNSAQRHNFVARLSISGAGHAAHEKTGPKTSCGRKRA
jgi:hypothetical protein